MNASRSTKKDQAVDGILSVITVTSIEPSHSRRGASADKARAEFKNGELQVTIPVQKSEGKRRQIPIGGAAPEGEHKK